MNDKNYKLFRDGVNLLEGIEATECHGYDNGDYSYKASGYSHLIREDEDLLKDVDATKCWVYADGSWGYEDEQGGHNMEKDERIKPITTIIDLKPVLAEMENLKENIKRINKLIKNLSK